MEADERRLMEVRMKVMDALRTMTNSTLFNILLIEISLFKRRRQLK